MKLDLLFELEVPKPWTNGQQKEEQRVYREAIEQIELADKLGFATVWMVEHHFRQAFLLFCLNSLNELIFLNKYFQIVIFLLLVKL